VTVAAMLVGGLFALAHPTDAADLLPSLPVDVPSLPIDLPSVPVPIPTIVPTLPPPPTLPPLPTIMPTLRPLPSVPLPTLPPVPTLPPLPSLPTPSLPTPSVPLPSLPTPSLPTPSLPGSSGSPTQTPTTGTAGASPTPSPTPLPGGGGPARFLGEPVTFGSAPPTAAARPSPALVADHTPSDDAPSRVDAIILPGLLIGVPAILVIAALIAQLAVGAAWLPVIRRWLHRRVA
jgi:hypothetical protein